MKESSKRKAYSEHGEITLLAGPPSQASRHVRSEMLEMDQTLCQSRQISNNARLLLPAVVTLH